MISVIVPVYKVQDYLPRCIDSILSQSYKDIEVILVDDGSPDECGRICDEYSKKDSRIVVVHKVNGGLSSARNAGLDIAKGEYISFVDSDDWLDSRFLENLYNALINTDAQMSACKFCRTKGDEVTRAEFEEDIHTITTDRYACVFDENSYAGYAWNKLFSKDIIDKYNLRFDEKIFNGEDFPFTIRYVHHIDKVAFIKQDLYYYFFRESGIMNTIRLSDRFVTILYAREQVLDFLTQHAPDVYDRCKASYLSILCKIKYMAMLDMDKHLSLYSEVNAKIKSNKKGLFSLKGVKTKDKIKLWLMINFPSVMSKIYKKKVKVI
ncbi:MAG: glycosyltransferase family 2 protein [Clostridia bacterium]|nr:glycosyltransferase family 2 protein [Clostridia bacterium]